jgi:hypothetical protein
MLSLATEFNVHVVNVYDAAFEAGRQQALREMRCSLNVLKANVSNSNLTDTRFRKITRDIVREIAS